MKKTSTSMWLYPRIIAHRGGGILAPENTLAALQCGHSHGYQGVEFDVMLTQDRMPILMHDANLGRTLAGSGYIPDFTLQEILCMDAGAWFGPTFAGEPVCTLQTALAYCSAQEMWMNIEIKPAQDMVAHDTGHIVAETTKNFFADTLATLQKSEHTRMLPLFSSFSLTALMAAKARAPEIPRGLLVDAIPPDWEERLHALDAVSLHLNHQFLSKQQVRAVKNAGFSVFCYTVNDPLRVKELFAWGVDGLCTDRLDLIS